MFKHHRNGIILMLSLTLAYGIAVPTPGYKNLTVDKSIEVENATVPGDLIIIKEYVYEVGILSEGQNDTNKSTESDEEIDLTFFNPKHNGTQIDLSNIPLPIQTNISGVSITGVAPINLGTLDLAANNGTPIINGTILPNAVVSVKHNISTIDGKKGEDLLTELSPLLNLNPEIQKKPK